MKLGPIAIQLRKNNTRFKDRVAGAGDFVNAQKNGLRDEAAFVIPLSESCPTNQYDNSVNQKITERFGVVVAIKNDSVSSDKTGITAFDSLHTIREQIFSSILGWEMEGAESKIYFLSGSLLDLSPAWLWYQYEFAFESRLDDDDGVPEGYTDEFETLYTQVQLWPSVYLPYEGDLPVTSFTPDMVTQVDEDDDWTDGPFDRAFYQSFDWYPKDDPWYP